MKLNNFIKDKGSLKSAAKSLGVTIDTLEKWKTGKTKYSNVHTLTRRSLVAHGISSFD